MKKSLIILVAAALIILNFLLLLFLMLRAEHRRLNNPAMPQKVIAKKTVHSEGIGEKITYDVCLGFITIGKAVFIHNPDVPWGDDGGFAGHMTFETSLASFKDREDIYSDIATGLPLKILRDIQMLTGKEKITEQYDQKDFKLSITKVKPQEEASPTEVVLQKKGPIHNAILLPFYLRRIPELSEGWSFKAELPTKEFAIKLTRQEKITVPAGEFDVFRFESSPRQFEIWITADKRRLPVKIKGAGIGAYYLMMRDYLPPEAGNKSTP